MKRKFTFILTSLLLLAVGVNAEPVSLKTSGGQNVWCESKDGYTEVSFNHNSFNGKWNGYYGDDWVANLPSGKKHRFVFTFHSGVSSDLTLHFIVAKDNGGDWNDGTKVVDEVIEAGATSFQYDVDVESYKYVQLVNTGTSGAKLEVVSVTREEIDASAGPAVNVPTISPATGSMYDGELNVTIAKGEDNTKVVYNVSGSAAGDVENAEFTSDNMVLNLTGTGTITVTATGYNGEDASAEVTCTYTYGVPEGKTTAAVTYYNYKPVTIAQDDKTVAFFDFEDDTAIGNWGNGGNDGEIAARKPTVIINTTDAVKGNKCMFIKNKYGVMDQDWHAEFGFNTPNDGDNIIYLTHGHTYYLHFWAKAEENTTVTMNFKNRGDWSSTPHHYDVEIGTEWQEYTAYVFVPSWDASNFSVELGKNTVGLYFDDFGLFEVTSSTDATDFADATSTAVVAASAFSGSAVGDLVQLNIVGTPAAVATQAGTGYDQYQAYMTNLTPLEQTSGNWLVAVTEDVLANGLAVKGYEMTLASVDIFKTVTLSENADNDIQKNNQVAVLLGRELAAGTWSTICLPFKPTADQAEALFGADYKLAEFTGVSGAEMQFTTLTDISDFVAGRPYLVRPTADITAAVLTNVDITVKTPASVTIGGYSFVGSFVTKTFDAGDAATARLVASEYQLETPASGDMAKALSAYFVAPADEADARSFSVDGESTSVREGLSMKGGVSAAATVYNLAGQRVAQPTKGLYIVNGVKVVIK